MNAVVMPSNQNAQCPCGLEKACQRISSLEKKPESPGIPAIAHVAISMVQNV